tara:strand:- start:538 stop:678 length:141 start_codon:yes stop_codon:yes gene_type:complete
VLVEALPEAQVLGPVVPVVAGERREIPVIREVREIRAVLLQLYLRT